MASIELRQVCKSFPSLRRGFASAETKSNGAFPEAASRLVLDHIDLQVEDGELVVLVGPNGSGKTTLLRLLAGLESPTSGEIWLGSQRVEGWSPRRRDVAMVFSTAALYPHLTVRENVEFGLEPTVQTSGWIGWWQAWRRKLARLAGRPLPADLAARVDEMGQWLGYSQWLDRWPRELSSGERQRVALGRALVRRPAVFLLDEPLASADVRLRREMRWQFQEVRRRVPGTMLLVTHDHEEALALGQRIVVLHEGRVQQIGRPRELREAPRNRFVAEFLGASGMSFLRATCRSADGQVWLEQTDGERTIRRRVGRPELVPPTACGKQVELGWRPAAAKLTTTERMAGEGGVSAGGVSAGCVSASRDQDADDGWSAEWLATELRGEQFVGVAALPGGCRVAGRLSAELHERGALAGPVGSLSHAAECRAGTGTEEDRLGSNGKQGRQVQLVFDWEQVLWFDAQTGASLRGAGPRGSGEEQDIE